MAPCREGDMHKSWQLWHTRAPPNHVRFSEYLSSAALFGPLLTILDITRHLLQQRVTQTLSAATSMQNPHGSKETTFDSRRILG
jgi:hypothetical protein